jgi:hypothetical protein
MKILHLLGFYGSSGPTDNAELMQSAIVLSLMLGWVLVAIVLYFLPKLRYQKRTKTIMRVVLINGAIIATLATLTYMTFLVS